MKDELDRAKELAKAHAEGVNTAMHLYLLTRREMFALAAMQGLLANPNVTKRYNVPNEIVTVANLELCALNKADTLLKALER